jgi:hypothetical protein
MRPLFLALAWISCIFGGLAAADDYNPNDPSLDHTEHAIDMDEGGDMDAALVAFRYC